MLRSAFAYDLPAELIAQFPAAERDGARLLLLSRATGAVADRRFAEFPELLRAGDLLVLNDTRVVPARLFGSKASGGRVEILLERFLDDGRMLAQLRASKRPRPGSTIRLEGGAQLEVVGRDGEFWELACEAGASLKDLLARAGHVPLPPYIRRADAPADRERYQTVFAKRPGAVAAPTAGLHFTERMLEALRGRGIGIETLTLHVGAGTFQPVRAEQIEAHRMHREWMEVGEPLCRAVLRARERGGRVVAAGTTVVRALESAAAGGALAPMSGETDIFIYPGYRFRVVDALLTNFHLPESTLLMLACAFGGTEHVLGAYAHAVRERYRFYSYGDAMFIS